MAQSYYIPAEVRRTELEVANSRFIATAAPAKSVEEARAFVARMRAEMHDATHHVYAFRVGYGNSVIEGMSDDGEPSGTAGPPTLAVLRGADLGDIVIVVTRFFGGAKLGTGGLVRAYSSAARACLEALKTEPNIPRQLIGLEVSYAHYEQVKKLITGYSGVLQDETFAGDVTILALLPVDHLPAFNAALNDLTAGHVQPVLFNGI